MYEVQKRPGLEVSAVLEGITACCRVGELCEAELWLMRLRSMTTLEINTGTPCDADVSSAVRALCEAGIAQKAEALVSHLARSPVGADVSCFLPLIEHFAAKGDVPRAEEWLRCLAMPPGLCQNSDRPCPRTGNTCEALAQGFAAAAWSAGRAHGLAEAELWGVKADEWPGAARGGLVHDAVICVCAQASDVEVAKYWVARRDEVIRIASGSPGKFEGRSALVAEMPMAYSTLLDLCAAQADLKGIEAWYSLLMAEGGIPEPRSFLRAVRAFAKEGDIPGAERWLRRAQKLGLSLGVSGHNAVLATLAKQIGCCSDAAKQAEQWLYHMSTQGVDPDVVSFNIVLSAFARCGMLGDAESLIGAMVARGIEPDTATLSTAMQACAKGKEAQRAERLFKLIASRGSVHMDAVCHNMLIDVFVKVGNADRAQKWLDDMHSCGVKPSTVSHTTVLHAHARNGDVDAAERGISQMLRDGVAANVVTYSAMVQAYGKAGNLQGAEKWFSHMMREGITPNMVSFSVLLNVCAKNGDADRAERWLQAMCNAGIVPNEVCYNNVIDACAKCGHAERAESWLRKLEEEASAGRRCSPVDDSLPLVCPHSAPGTAQPRCLEPTRQSYTSAAQAFAVQARWTDVQRLFSNMEARGICMDEVSLTVLLSAYARARPRERDRAQSAFRHYHAQGGLITRPPVHVLRGILGSKRCSALLADLGLDAQDK